jgi:hypothetical protein
LLNIVDLVTRDQEIRGEWIGKLVQFLRDSLVTKSTEMTGLIRVF